jgi:hypothetical protein
MLRSGLGSLMAALALGAALLSVTVARADDTDDDFKSLMADCNRPDLPASDINDCMERARVLDESRPSPQLQHLLTQLERRTEDGGSPQLNKPSAPATTGPHALLGSTAPSPIPVFAVRASRDGQTTSEEAQPRKIEAPDEAAPSAEYEGEPVTPPKQPSHG